MNEDMIRLESFQQFDDLAATAMHIDVVQSRLDRLEEVKRESWEQLLTTVARLHRQGRLTTAQLLAFSREMHHSYGPGYSRVWDRNIAIPVKKLRHVVAREERAALDRARPHWSGTWPLSEHDLAPSIGVSGVYVLFDRDGVPAYIGSSETFRSRMHAHKRNFSGVFDRWVFYVCEDREAAYELEVRLLREKLPYLNKKAGR